MLYLLAPQSGAQHAMETPVLLSRAGAAGPEAESSRKFLLFSFCPRLITSPQALVTDQLCMHPDPPISLLLSMESLLLDRQVLSLHVTLELYRSEISTWFAVLCWSHMSFFSGPSLKWSLCKEILR